MSEILVNAGVDFEFLVTIYSTKVLLIAGFQNKKISLPCSVLEKPKFILFPSYLFDSCLSQLVDTNTNKIKIREK
jgi:hypothetical protein